MPDRRSQNETANAPQPNERIRILFLIPSFKTGGAEIQLLSLVRGLDKSLFHVSVAAFYKGNELDRFYEDSPDTTIFYLNKKGALDFSAVRRLLSLIRQHKFHIVQSYNVSARLFGMITAKRAGVPISIVTERTARLLYSSLGSRVYLFFEKFAIRSADLLIANSNAGREFAVSRGVQRDRTRVIYNGIDPERLQVRRDTKKVRQEFLIPMDAFLVGMIARVEKLKDPFTFIDAARSLIRKYENIYFMLVGDGALLKSVREAVSAELQSRIVFTGFRTDTADLLNSMDVVTLTSKQVEGCSNSLLEAMSLRKPVIATRVGGNTELIEHEKNGLLISPSQPAELADAVERLYHNASLRVSLAENAHHFVDEKFSQKTSTTHYMYVCLNIQIFSPEAGQIQVTTVHFNFFSSKSCKLSI